MAIDELELRLQNSKGDPWYFQVRSPRFRQVLAYVHVSAAGVKVDYRLPMDHETGGRAVARDNLYGITYRLTDESEIDFAMKLISDALVQPEVFDEVKNVERPAGEPASPNLIERAYRESPPAMRRFLDYLTDYVGQRLPNDEIADAIGLTRPQLAGVLGAFGRRWANRYQRRNAKWFFEADWMASPETGTWKWHYRMPPEAAEIIRNAQQMGGSSSETSLAEERVAEQPPGTQALHAALSAQWVPSTQEQKGSVAYRDRETNRVMVYIELHGRKVYVQAEEIGGVARDEFLARASDAGFLTGPTWVEKPHDIDSGHRLGEILGVGVAKGG